MERIHSTERILRPYAATVAVEDIEKHVIARIRAPNTATLTTILARCLTAVPILMLRPICIGRKADRYGVPIHLKPPVTRINVFEQHAYA